MRTKAGLVATLVAATITAGVAWAGPPDIDCTMGGACAGTPKSEFLQGGPLRDQIAALAGDDGIEGEGAVDLLRGNGGADVLEGGPKGDTMKGGPGNDRAPFIGRAGIPGLNTSPGFFGDEGNDKIIGGGGNDHLEGEEGRDVMKGGAGIDYLDAINDDTQGTRDVLDCGKGFDRYSARSGDKVAGNCERKIPSLDDPIRQGSR